MGAPNSRGVKMGLKWAFYPFCPLVGRQPDPKISFLRKNVETKKLHLKKLELSHFMRFFEKMTSKAPKSEKMVPVA